MSKTLFVIRQITFETFIHIRRRGASSRIAIMHQQEQLELRVANRQMMSRVTRFPLNRTCELLISPLVNINDQPRLIVRPKILLSKVTLHLPDQTSWIRLALMPLNQLQSNALARLHGGLYNIHRKVISLRLPLWQNMNNLAYLALAPFLTQGIMRMCRGSHYSSPPRQEAENMGTPPNRPSR